jgi:hypothetical protein
MNNYISIDDLILDQNDLILIKGGQVVPQSLPCGNACGSGCGRGCGSGCFGV